MARLLVARAPTAWRHVALTVLAITAHLLLGLIVGALRTTRVIVDIVTETATAAERALAAYTGRPALSQTGIRALAVAFATEFHTAYHHQPTR